MRVEWLEAPVSLDGMCDKDFRGHEDHLTCWRLGLFLLRCLSVASFLNGAQTCALPSVLENKGEFRGLMGIFEVSSSAGGSPAREQTDWAAWGTEEKGSAQAVHCSVRRDQNATQRNGHLARVNL